MAAVGRSGAKVVESKVDLYMGDICLVGEGKPLFFSRRSAARVLRGKEVRLSLNLNLGTGTATAWGCDLTPEYVAINSEYTT
jgi:glutamate N-acetyltransferase/amino-acid N-acetyltransferase